MADQRKFIGLDDNSNILSPIMSGMFSPTFEQKAMITNTDLDSVLEKMSGSSHM